MIVSAIAAMAKNRVIGVDGDLPWTLPEDLQFFKNKTKGKIIIMGRKTFESLPKPLPNRLHVVITRNKDYVAPEGVHVFTDINKAMAFCRTELGNWDEEVMVIGGGEIYRQTLDFTDYIYLTEIDKEFAGDAKFPEFGDEFILAQKDERYEPMNYSFNLYKRQN